MTGLNYLSLVESMKDPSFYPHPVEGPEFIQTHISCVFLTGELVYKLKKPVDFGFLNFTTVELRRENCFRELELNRRLAPDVYLRVEPITRTAGLPTLGGSGPELDWVVVMRQLDQELLGLKVLDRGELTTEKIEGVVDRLVPFYRAARTGPGVDEHGSLETVKFNADENFEQTAGFVGLALSPERYEDIQDFTNRFFEKYHDLFQHRADQGWVRESHGDLHLGNIFFENPPVIFDCIEFNPRLSCGDVAADLAFLVMDLDFQGQGALAKLVVDRYVEKSGDTGFLGLVDFYSCYRAYVRGKIACFTSSDPAIGAEGQRQQLELAARYFELSHLYAAESGHGRGVE